MGFWLERDEPVAAGIRRIAGEQMMAAVAEVEDEKLGVHETVHQVRKRCKKIRSLIRLARPGFSNYRCENRCYRDAARLLSEVRDAHSIIETFNRLLESLAQRDFDDLKPIGDALVRHRDEVIAGVEKRLVTFRELMIEGQVRIDSWMLQQANAETVLDGLRKSRRRSGRMMNQCREDPITRSLHEWRKRVKCHWYHLRLLNTVWPQIRQGYTERTHGLSDQLGNDHDLAVLMEMSRHVSGERPPVVRLARIVEKRRGELQKAALTMGQRLFAEGSIQWRVDRQAQVLNRPPAAGFGRRRRP